VGTVIAAVYLLRVLRLVWHGAAGDARLRVMDDATRHEVMVASPLVVATVALGLLPWLLLDLTGPAVRVLLSVTGGTP
jgi:NADH-quinone oxidoreductase subunit M